MQPTTPAGRVLVVPEVPSLCAPAVAHVASASGLCPAPAPPPRLCHLVFAPTLGPNHPDLPPAHPPPPTPTVFDVHKTWCGQCKVMEPTWKRIFLDYDDADSRIVFASVASSDIPALEEYTERSCEPLFLLYKVSRRGAHFLGQQGPTVHPHIRPHARHTPRHTHGTCTGTKPHTAVLTTPFYPLPYRFPAGRPTRHGPNPRDKRTRDRGCRP